jgi:hypothetical protein
LNADIFGQIFDEYRVFCCVSVVEMLVILFLLLFKRTCFFIKFVDLVVCIPRDDQQDEKKGHVQFLRRAANVNNCQLIHGCVLIPVETRSILNFLIISTEGPSLFITLASFDIRVCSVVDPESTSHDSHPQKENEGVSQKHEVNCVVETIDL